MPRRIFIITSWIVILCLGASLRLYELSNRPMHADEATGAKILAERLEDKQYTFRPHHFHGPMLSFSSMPLAKIRKESKWQELSKNTLRLSPVIAGCLLLLTPLLWIHRFGQGPALASAALLASSPLLIYYSRMYIHETWLTLFALLGVAAIYRFAHKPGILIALVSGVLIGLMYATKETFIITLISWVIALGIAAFVKREIGYKPSVSIALVALLALSAMLTATFFYSDNFRSLQGAFDAIKTFFIYETTPGHEKGFFYYFHLLLWPKRTHGFWWTELAIALFALIAAFIHRKQPVVLFLSVATSVHLLLYSLISYKTPWLMLVPWAHACLLAGYVFYKVKKRFLMPIICCFIMAIGYQSYVGLQLSTRASNHASNPYAYVPSSRDIETLEVWLGKLPIAPQETLAVIGSSYWPLPWYLRNFENLGYYPTAISPMQNNAIVFAMPSEVQQADMLLSRTHTKLLRSIRSNVALTVYLRNEIWEAWINEPE